MSSSSFSKSLFRDIAEIVSVAENAEKTGSRPSNADITTFAATIKRCKQTLQDWELFSSLQDGNQSIKNISTEVNALFQIAVQTVKQPQQTEQPSPVNEQYSKTCTVISNFIGKEETQQIPKLAEFIAKNSPCVTRVEKVHQPTAQFSPEIHSELKKLAMKAIVSLKELSTIVLKSLRTRESTAAHFASYAKTAVQTAQKLSTFAMQFNLKQEASTLNGNVVTYIQHSKEIFIRPIPEGEEQDMIASQLEKDKATIAACIKDIIKKSTTIMERQSQELMQSNVLEESATQSPEPTKSEQQKEIDPASSNSPVDKADHQVDITRAEANHSQQEETSTEQEILQKEEGKLETEDSKPKLISATLEVETEEERKKLEEKSLKRAKDRQHAFNEILSSENIYFKNLQFLYWSVILRLEEEAKKPNPVVTPSELKQIFSNWQSLLTFNKELLKKLEQRRKVPIEERMVGDTFLELASLMKMYTDFVNNFDTSNRVASTCMERPEFSAIVHECLQGSPTPGLTLSSYLIMPVQRLPRYEMLLRALLKLTEESHPDYTNLDKACKQVKAINDHVNLKKKEAENRNVVYGIQEKILGYQDLVQAHRMFIREGELQFSNSANPKKTKKRELYYFYLFNDLLLRCKYNKKKEIHEVKESYALTEYSLRDVTYSPFMSSSERFCFRLVLQRDERSGISFFANSQEEKSDWYVDFEETIRNRDAADSSRYR